MGEYEPKTDEQKYYSIDSLVKMIDEPNQTSCRQFLDENKELLRTARGSKANHQYWEGGYTHHITEIMNIGVQLYPTLNRLRTLPFTLSDVLIGLFLHDIEKPWKYELRENCEVKIKPEMKDRNYIKQFGREKIKEYGFKLTEDHFNAIDYAEGEIGVWTPGKRTMKPIAAFVHMCDVWSARGWHDEPKERSEKTNCKW
ncbi:hypothetical protein HN587_05240 [Candidatus Woesearchaeota archaeon]|jgi:hypothetical protein|nr:hypothetical protein [Candidatus Woesearchaeota archaeon]